MASGVCVRGCFLLLVLAGCGSDVRFRGPAPDADVEPPVPEATPAFVQFGELCRDEVSTVVVAVANEGGSLLDVESVTIEGDPSFTLGDLRGLPVALANGETVGIPVTFQPAAGGMVEASLVFRFAALDAEPLAVPLAGLGAVPRLVVDPDPIDLGAQLISCPSVWAVQLSNAGKEPLHVDAVRLEDVDPGLDFGAPPELPVTLEPGRSAQVSLAWFPEVVGDVGGTLVVTSDDPDGERRVPILGEGLPGPSWTDLFETPASWGFDVLFAVDHSCSMGPELPAIGAELVAFADRLVGARVDWRFGLIGGEDPACLTTGIVEPSLSDWRERVTGGLGTAAPKPLTESLLEATSDAAAEDAVGRCNAGFRRPSAELHVVVMSDERDQSAGFDVAPGAYWTGYVDALRTWAGDPDKLAVHAIVDTDPNGTCGEAPVGPGGYAEAAAATGGQLLDLCAGAWADSLDLVASSLVGRVGRFELSRDDVVRDTIVITVDGAPRRTGWTYDAVGPAVTLDPAPAPGSQVAVTYGLQADCGP